MLSSIEALALMYGQNLSGACDRYADKKRFPSAIEIRGLARIWYIREIVVRSVETEGVIPIHPALIDMEAHSAGNPPPYTQPDPFSPVIGFRPNVHLEEQARFNDGVVYLTYRPHEAGGDYI